MRVTDILLTTEDTTFSPIAEQCTQFLDASMGMPLLKNLPRAYDDFRKVKVRKHKSSNTFTNTFNDVFENRHRDLRKRAIFVNGSMVSEGDDLTEPFYIFPIDGYKYLYSKEVRDSTDSYKKAFESLFDTLGEESGKDVFAELLKFTYTTTNLVEGITSGAEIIIYGIPYYYALRASTVDNYKEHLTTIQGL